MLAVVLVLFGPAGCASTANVCRVECVGCERCEAECSDGATVLVPQTNQEQPQAI